MARVDYLTHIPNKLGFDEQLKIEIARHRRDRNPFAVAYIDCDNFKSVNDTRGHAAGDRVLKVVAETARANLRVTDVFARLGGDEFAVILPDRRIRRASGHEQAAQSARYRRREEPLAGHLQYRRWRISGCARKHR
jgi:diguanylate cyclase (GGDEF)-like protein